MDRHGVPQKGHSFRGDGKCQSLRSRSPDSFLPVSLLHLSFQTLSAPQSAGCSGVGWGAGAELPTFTSQTRRDPGWERARAQHSHSASASHALTSSFKAHVVSDVHTEHMCLHVLKRNRPGCVLFSSSFLSLGPSCAGHGRWVAHAWFCVVFCFCRARAWTGGSWSHHVH